MARREKKTAPHRAPLFLFVLPFAAGLILSRLLPIESTLPSLVLLAVLLLLLLGVSPRQKSWLSYFLFASLVFGVLSGGRILPPGNTKDFSGDKNFPPREETINLAPVQVFLSPPFSADFLGLGASQESGRLLLYRAPSAGHGSLIAQGMIWRLRGVERSLADSSADADFLSYLDSRGVVGAFDAVVPPEPAGLSNLLQATFSKLRQEALAALAEGSDPTEPATRIYQALVLGQRIGLEPGQKAVFRDTGTAHLFAISGLHVGLVGTFLLLFFRCMGIRGPVQVWTSLLVLLFYVMLTGAAPSAVRAYSMVAFLVGAKALNRGYRAESALAASALVVLTVSPHQLFSLGFQLSYTVVLSLLVFGVPLARELIRLTDPPFIEPDRPRNPWRKPRVWILTSLSISFAAFLASAPISIDHFEVLPLSAVFLNLLLIPPASIVLGLGILSLFAGLIGIPFVSALLNRIARSILDIMYWLVSRADAVPGASLPADYPSAWLGPLLLLAFLGCAFWAGTRPAFRKWHLFPPTALLVMAAAVSVTG